MVVITKLLQAAHIKKGRKFLDSLRVYVRGGAGGNGIPKYGGQGGPGGNIYVVGGENITMKDVLKRCREKRYIAGNGDNSRSRALLGAPGKDVTIPVPLGVTVKNDVDRNLGEVNTAADTILVARGGPGGGPTNNFLGQKGHRQSIRLEFQLIADIGLVGFPNAGKSTLLSAVSRAAPKIASYPFTTIQPQVGTMIYPDLRQITMADLPGLIEGAHINVGMGHNFLKHVERTKILLFMVDLQGFRLGVDYPLRSAFQTILLLNKELELYKPELMSKPAVLALNKLDVEGAEDHLEEVREHLTNMKEPGYLDDIPESLRPTQLVKFDDIIPISAKKHTGTDHLKSRLRELLDLYADIEWEKEHGESRDRALQTVGDSLRERHPSGRLV